MSYVRNTWYVASWAEDVGTDKPSAVSILGEPIVLWRSEGHLIALEDRCVHRLAALSLGRCEGPNLRCMYHGMVFNAAGRVIKIPGQDLIPPHAKVHAYPVIEKDSWAWVWMGDPAKADEALIPPAIGFDNPDWLLDRSFLDYQAEAQLINDNLLDLSHAAFVHANSFQADPEVANVPPNIEILPRGIRFTRWITDQDGDVLRRTGDKVDSYQTYDYLIPGILTLWNGQFAAGTARACNFGKPDYADAIGAVVCTNQAVTPTGKGTTRYFFSSGPHRAHGDEKMRDFLMSITRQAFAEDKVVIEAQQKIIDSTPNPVIMPIAHDRSVVLFHRMVERLCREEKETLTQAG